MSPSLHDDLGLRKVRAARGFTAVEIILSIAVLGIGAAGVMSMQSASIVGNADAHMMDLGNSIAREWVERLRRDATTWTMPEPNSPTTPTTGLWTQTLLISQIGGGTAGTYVYPVVPTTTGFNANNNADPGFGNTFDILGRDMIQPAPAAQSATVFCTQIRGDWLVQDQLLRAQVRVYWLRQLFTAPTGPFCATGDGIDGTGIAGTGASIYHAVYATTALARNAAAQ
jgi:prepilin-type N-terminal cleavage/methylation domain-containing protein